MTPIRICRVHNTPEFQTTGHCAVGEMALISTALADARVCVIVRMRWSADSHALLEVAECDRCERGVLGSGDDCASCESGWRYVARTDIDCLAPDHTEIDHDMMVGGEGPCDMMVVAVVPVKPLDKEQ